MTDPVDRPEPVLDAARIAGLTSGAVVAVGAVFVLVGWTTAEQVQNWATVAGGVVTAVGALLAYLLPLVTARGARAQVTPLAAPVGVDGVPLITSAQPAAQAVTYNVTAPTPAPAAPVSAVPDDLDVTQALARLDAIDGGTVATHPTPPDAAENAPTPTYDAVAADLAKQPAPLDDHTRPMQAVANGTPAPTA